MQLAKQDTVTSDNKTTPEGAEHHNDLQAMLTEADTLMQDMRKLIVKSDEALLSVGVKDEVEVIERWIESYRRGLSAANKISTAGTEIINSLRSRLKLAADEIIRLEGEGGNTEVNQEQLRRMEQLTKASARFEKLIPQIEQIFCACPTEEQPKE